MEIPPNAVTTELLLIKKEKELISKEKELLKKEKELMDKIKNFESLQATHSEECST